LTDAQFKNEETTEHVSKVKIVDCDSKLLSLTYVDMNQFYFFVEAQPAAFRPCVFYLLQLEDVHHLSGAFKPMFDYYFCSNM
jgi:hypothetical protein